MTQFILDILCLFVYAMALLIITTIAYHLIERTKKKNKKLCIYIGIEAVLIIAYISIKFILPIYNLY